MTILEAIKERHSVRQYKIGPIDRDTVETLRSRIFSINRKSGLNIQLVTDEPKAFAGPFARYGKFSGVSNYLVIAAKKTDQMSRLAGYYGEELVILAQSLGLNSCWVGLTYSKIPGAFKLEEGQKIICVISLGYGETMGVQHKSRSAEQVSNVTEDSPQWFKDGVAAAQLCPTAVNQQKYHFTHINKDGIDYVRADKGHSMIGYTEVDLGIAMYHFEAGAGKENFK